ncbi:hypothetical protein PV10_06957 [Exophiala mesophila]|uniref:Rad4 beta-hairpin domain-containing protein n=1 Tax=Exophiala mesophila TaxID=212818 RepID=A0A0D1Z485_EXOME|nr:uncharacterized protein PV10_06957 [Exophiala mesophila]KIV89567.1 hypothetical protein PV10_06957 [Exophiala mesophila]
MPPFLPRKRLNDTPPPVSHQTPPKKPRLTDVLDAQPRNGRSLQSQRAFSLGSDDSDSSLSEIDSDEVQDVSPVFTKSTTSVPPSGTSKVNGDDESEDDDDIEWEDAGAALPEQAPVHTPLADGPIELVFRKDDVEIDYGTAATATSGKKGPTKREKEARIRTHQMHVQFLLWHNSIRNRWISDQTVQQTLIQQLPAQVKKEVDRWKRASGLTIPGSKSKETKDKNGKRRRQDKSNPRNERDWGRPSQLLEPGRPDMSNGDPLIHLLKVLAAYWKKRFAITAPGLRKRGYGTKQSMKQIIYSFRNDEHDPEEHGERIKDLGEFRQLAKRCEGSRDVGAQLFTALLRGLGIESRLVASLQPSGFGWTKAEQMLPKRAPTTNDYEESSSASDDSDEQDSKSISEIAKPKPVSATRRGKKPASATPINLDTDDDSVVDVTPSIPKRRPQKYDRDVFFPIYWTEAISPITNKVLPVSPLVLTSPVASNPDVLYTFEPRGAKAEKSKTIIAYVVAYSSDGTAKDVTVRYLKNRIWPGKTKGFRFPIEKIPIYNKYGKVKRYEDYDWFKHVMSGYRRPGLMRTAVDDIEETTDLVPQLPPKKDVKEDVDTLQSLKSSADFVLERFLRREEALRPNAEPVRTFVSGKGDNLKEEPVYRRSDVERCLTAESWHKEGRRPLAGEAPMKLVPVRAVTLTRKREAEEHERVTGQKQMQGLYSWDQTEYIIPPPIENGVIPKNAYGNIDCFVPSMVPRGAVHVPLRGTVRLCKRLDIDFAEAVTGFEFGNKRAVPVCTGVVVAKENEKLLKDAWREFNEQQRKKEETKMEKLVLELWRKFVMGLRIREKVQDTYGDAGVPEVMTGFSRDRPIALDDDEDDENRGHSPQHDDDFGGGFLLDDEEPQIPEDLEMVHHEEPPPAKALKGKERATTQYPTPSSISQIKPAVRRQRKSLLQEAETSESNLTELSASASDLKDEESDDDSDARSVASNIKPPNRSQQKARIEVTIPKVIPKRSTQRASMVVDSDSEELSNMSSEGSLDTGTEDDYVPRSSTRRSAQARLKQKSQSEPTPSTRSSRRNQKTPTEADDGGLETHETPKKTRRGGRLFKRDSTLVTSPYFQG